MSTLSEQKYKDLLAEALPAVIQTQDEFERLLAITNRLGQKWDREGLTPEEDRLFALLATLTDDYETRQYAKLPRQTTPLEELKLFMEEHGVQQKDIWHLFGSKGIASDGGPQRKTPDQQDARETAGRVFSCGSRAFYLRTTVPISVPVGRECGGWSVSRPEQVSSKVQEKQLFINF